MVLLIMFVNGEIYLINILGYNFFKIVINVLILVFSKEFVINGLEVFGVIFGFIIMDFNGNFFGGYIIIESVKIIIKYVLSEINYNGKIFNKDGIIFW